MTDRWGALLFALAVTGAVATAGAASLPVLPLVLTDPATEAGVTVEAGSPTHLVFLATWCPECLEELPALRELDDRWSGRGYRLILVAVSTRQEASRLRTFLAQREVPGTLLWDRDGSVASALGVSAIPTHILTGSDGEEAGRWARMEEVVEKAVERAVTGPRP